MNLRIVSFFLFALTYVFLLTQLTRLHAAEPTSTTTPPPHSTEYRVGLYGGDLIVDVSKVTHIIVIGSAQKEDSDQFFQSGLARARRYKENSPDDQVVFISSPDVRNTPDDAVFAKYNIVVLNAVMKGLTADFMLDEMMPFTQIASWDFFGHSSPWGLKIGSTNASFSPYDYEVRLVQLRSHFLPNAYVTLNACNTGFAVSPDLSQILRLPVSGALTSAVFERIESDGMWYKEEDWSKNIVDLNKFSFNKTVLCSEGLCFRMKPSRFNYDSIWGQFKEGGLSFAKFFCNFTNTDGRCERGMANSLFGFPSVLPININSEIDAFKAVAYDWICSTKSDHDYFQSCVNGIEDAIARMDLVFQTHPGNELMCDFKTCNAVVYCQNDQTGTPKYGTCRIKTPLNPEPTNAAREMLSFIKGLYALKNNLHK